jgi:hypothetical protein
MSAAADRVPLSELVGLLTAGEPLPFRVLDGTGRLLLGAGQRALDASQIEALVERGACVDAEEAAALRRARGVGAGAPAAAAGPPTWFDDWEAQMWALDGQLRRLLREPGPSHGVALQALVDRQLVLIDRFADGALFLLVRQDDRRHALYPLTHGMHAATVAVLGARVLGWPPARVRSLAAAALTMNLAIVDLQARMAEQSEPPDSVQLAQIRAHPARAVALLRAAGVEDEEWLAAVAQHHERTDGSGYPDGLGAVHETAQLLRAADVFSAKISPRALRPSMAPQVAARELFQAEAGGPLAMAVIKAVGIYPPGDWVQLRNGDVGIVTRRARDGTAAVVAALRNAQGRALPQPLVCDTGQAAQAIAAPLADRSGLPRVLPEQVYGLVYD